MSNAVTRHFIAAYFQELAVVGFFSGMFRARPETVHNAAEVEIDIQREDEDVAIVIHDISTGYRFNADDLYVNKSIAPPVYKEAVVMNSSDLLKRSPGDNPFKDVGFRGKIISRFFRSMRKIQRKIERAIELQASQVMQTGKVTLTDINGLPLYELDYKPKTTHFPTAGTAWGEVGATPMADIMALADVVRSDGKRDPDELIMGEAAFEAFVSDPKVIERLNIRRADLGTITPASRRGGGGTFRGTISIGNYNYDIYTNSGTYKHPVTNVSTRYLATGNVIVRASGARMDKSFGAIPNIGKILGATQNLLPELPGRFTSIEGGMDLFTNVWLDITGENLYGGVGARPLMIPVEIDSFGCLDTGLE